MIDGLFTVRKDQFKSHPAIQSGLDLVDENDQYTHILELDDFCDPQPLLGKINFQFNQIVDFCSII